MKHFIRLLIRRNCQLIIYFYSLILAMSIMSLISLLSPVLAQWSQAFFAVRLILGLASVLLNFVPLTSNTWYHSLQFHFRIIKDVNVHPFRLWNDQGFGVANNPAALFPLVGSGWTRNPDRISFRWLHAGQFHHFPDVRFSMRIRFRRWMAIHFLPFWLVPTVKPPCHHFSSDFFISSSPFSST